MIDKDYKLVAVKTWRLLFEGELPVIGSMFILERWDTPFREEYLSLYKRVGEEWGWTGRLLVPDDELQRKLSDPLNEVWLFKLDELLLGFFEIDRSVRGNAEIIYLGLLPEMIGKGFGKPFLHAAIVTASGKNVDKIWLHTCEHDHPNALGIYLEVGFVIEEETIEHEYYPVDFINKKNRK